jgi:hypothetical protein
LACRHAARSINFLARFSENQNPSPADRHAICCGGIGTCRPRRDCPLGRCFPPIAGGLRGLAVPSTGRWGRAPRRDICKANSRAGVPPSRLVRPARPLPVSHQPWRGRACRFLLLAVPSLAGRCSFERRAAAQAAAGSSSMLTALAGGRCRPWIPLNSSKSPCDIGPFVSIQRGCHAGIWVL